MRNPNSSPFSRGDQEPDVWEIEEKREAEAFGGEDKREEALKDGTYEAGINRMIDQQEENERNKQVLEAYNAMKEEKEPGMGENA